MNERKLTFSEREGLIELPPQLKLGELSADFRRLLNYAFYKFLQRYVRFGAGGSYFDKKIEQYLMDVHVLFYKRSPEECPHEVSKWRESFKGIIERGSYNRVFDFVEFSVAHAIREPDLISDCRNSFVDARTAYRLVDSQVVAIVNEEVAAAYLGALDTARQAEAMGARDHLKRAGIALRTGDWSGSVRESISAVEAIVVRLAPEKRTLGAALGELERRGHLHGSLKAAFSQLYGYTSDEEGIRHANVVGEEARVDEADAIFMLGACAAFVTYVLERVRKQ